MCKVPIQTNYTLKYSVAVHCTHFEQTAAAVQRRKHRCVLFVLIHSGGTNEIVATTKVSSFFILGAFHVVLRLPFAHPLLFRRQTTHTEHNHTPN
jgi:hypothetical protein